MLNKKACVILVASLILTSLFGCGGGGSSANLDASTTSSNGNQTVTSATLVSIAITPTNPTMAVDTDIQFTATGIYSDNTTQDLTSTVTWTSSAVDAADDASGTQVAQITGFSASTTDRSSSLLSPGHTKATGTGKAKITATLGTISATTVLTVTEGVALSLTWDAPTTNTDGSSLNPATDLSLYKIYYGTASLAYTTVVNVTNPGTTTISQTLNLSPGTYYFAVTTVDASGQESSYSNEVMKTI
jgi:hypothetical protein